MRIFLDERSTIQNGLILECEIWLESETIWRFHRIGFWSIEYLEYNDNRRDWVEDISIQTLILLQMESYALRCNNIASRKSMPKSCSKPHHDGKEDERRRNTGIFTVVCKEETTDERLKNGETVWIINEKLPLTYSRLHQSLQNSRKDSKRP